MARTWVYQDAKQVQKHGSKAASWYAAWIDPEGRQRCKSFGAGSRAKKAAKLYADKIAADLGLGRYESPAVKSWDKFVEEYKSRVSERMSAGHRGEMERAIQKFTDVVKPKRVSAITTKDIDQYIAERLKEKNVRSGGKTKAKTVSVATVNKELRYVRTLLRRAYRWMMLDRVPEFNFIKEPTRIPTFISPEEFAKLYDNADVAVHPEGLPFAPGDFWRALLMTAYLTGWRIGELRSLRWEDVNLDESKAFLRAENTKGKRDESVKLHPVIVEHLRRIKSFSPFVFPWPVDDRELWHTFHAIQDAAEVKPDRKDRYGFHDLRRGFATMNADRMTADTLQKLMRHKSYATTQRYVNLTRQTDAAVDVLFVPTVGMAKPGSKILG